mgnify:FL=1|tara:strand:- start:2617 stop:3006 length:390 start_codon:yes stop_codon:yes gene_type:complete
MQIITQVSVFLIVLMFIISGFDKTVSLGTSEMSRFSIKTGLPNDISQIIVLSAGIYELLASGMVLYGTFNNDPMIASIGTYMLILFTLLATLIFYTMPLKYKPFLSNLSVVAGLYLMLNICFFKSEKLS